MLSFLHQLNSTGVDAQTGNLHSFKRVRQLLWAEPPDGGPGGVWDTWVKPGSPAQLNWNFIKVLCVCVCTEWVWLFMSLCFSDGDIEEGVMMEVWGGGLHLLPPVRLLHLIKAAPRCLQDHRHLGVFESGATTSEASAGSGLSWLFHFEIIWSKSPWSLVGPAAATPDPSPLSLTQRARRSTRPPPGEGWPPMPERGRGCRVWTPPSIVYGRWCRSGAKIKSCPSMKPCRWPSATSWPWAGSWRTPGGTLRPTGSGWTCSWMLCSPKPSLASWSTTSLQLRTTLTSTSLRATSSAYDAADLQTCCSVWTTAWKLTVNTFVLLYFFKNQQSEFVTRFEVWRNIEFCSNFSKSRSLGLLEKPAFICYGPEMLCNVDRMVNHLMLKCSFVELFLRPLLC